MTDEMWGSWAAESAVRQEAQDAREHRTMAELLLARGQEPAAALLAASTYTSCCVDNWGGGQYEVAIAVPAALFDRVDGETRAALEAAASDVVGGDHFRGLCVQVRLADPEPGWERAVLERVFGSSASSDDVASSDGGALRALPPGSGDGAH